MRNILIVDDSPEDWALIRQAFRKAAPGFSIFEVDRVSAAREYLQGEGKFSNRDTYPLPDLILCDVNLPGRGGFDLLDFVNHGNFPNLQIALMSSLFSEDARKRAYEHGACACIDKGDMVWDLDAFSKAVEDCLGSGFAADAC